MSGRFSRIKLTNNNNASQAQYKLVRWNLEGEVSKAPHQVGEGGACHYYGYSWVLYEG